RQPAGQLGEARAAQRVQAPPARGLGFHEPGLPQDSQVPGGVRLAHPPCGPRMSRSRIWRRAGSATTSNAVVMPTYNQINICMANYMSWLPALVRLRGEHTLQKERSNELHASDLLGRWRLLVGEPLRG